MLKRGLEFGNRVSRLLPNAANIPNWLVLTLMRYRLSRALEASLEQIYDLRNIKYY